MKQVITIFLKTNDIIENIRRKYLKNADKIEPHITLVYPFKIESQDKLNEHILKMLKSFKGFKLSLKGIQKSAKDYYLYLLVDKGEKEVVELHEKLNSGVLNDFRNPDMPKYIAHLSIGVFGSEDDINEAVNEISNMKIDFETEIDSIQLLTIDKDHTLKSKKSFKLDF